MKRLQAEVDGYLHIELVGHVLTDYGWGGFDHAHSFMELVYVLKGPVTFRSENVQCSVQQGQFIVIPSDLSHSITAMDPASFVYIGFKTNLVDLSEILLQPFGKDRTADCSILSVRLNDIVEQTFSEGISFDAFTPQLLALMIPAVCSLKTTESSHNPKEVLSNKIKQYIHHNYTKPIRVDEIAAGLYHTPHYLGNVFATVNGCTIKEYTMKYKMNKAIALLQNGSHTITDVANALGFESSHYFSRCFKSYFGFSPSTLRGKE